MIATIEPGLPGTGPIPVHFHTGRPTPWSEGVVVRFTPRSGISWIANLQPGYGYATKIADWVEADALIIIAKGAVYFVRPNEPIRWTFIDLLGIDCVIAPTRDVALISTYNAVVAVSTDGIVLWRRSLACDGVQITKIQDGLIHGHAGIDPDDEWIPFLLDLETGNDIARSDQRDPE